MSMIGAIEVAGSSDDPLEVELWAAELVGTMRAQLQPALPWEQPTDRDGAPIPDEDDFFATFATGIVNRLDGADHRTAELALHALTPFLPDRAAAIASDALDRVPDTAPLPDWCRLVGTAAVQECFSVDHETDDGHNLALVASFPGTDRTFLVMLLVDTNMSGLGRDILISEAIDEVRNSGIDEGFEMTDLAQPVVRARIEAALAMTDMTINAPVSDDFHEVRPILERLLASMPDPVVLPEREEPTAAELDELVEQLVQDAGITAPDHVERADLVNAAVLMCGFCSYRIGVDPMAWSPTRLEIFLVDYVPRRVAAPPEDLLALPELLALLVPAAHQRAGWADRHVEDATAIIDRFADEFRERVAAIDSAAGRG